MNITIDARVCKGCSLCLYYCPKDVFEVSGKRNEKGYDIIEVAKPGSCTGCRLCEVSCPDLAICLEK